MSGLIARLKRWLSFDNNRRHYADLDDFYREIR